MKVSVVIPVYNSSACLGSLLERLTAVLETLGAGYEIIMVEDCSPDDSWEMLQQLTGRYPALTAVQMMRNYGQAKATLCGLARAQGGYVITMDDDLQHPPEEIPGMLEYMEQHTGLDCVFGHFRQKKHAGYRNIASRIIRRVNTWAFRLPKNVYASTFRLMRGSVARSVVQNTTNCPSITALIYGATQRVESIPVRHDSRFAGTSNYTLAKQFRLAFDNICNVSMLPLQAVSLLGIVMCGLSLLYAVTVFFRYLMGRVSVPGWTTLAILVPFLFGITLLSLGVIGEYLVRVLREVRGEPQYVVRQTASGRTGDEN